ncbi:hypothetical protein FQN54_000923 [Arachnomyces sp. PD_36]|nr:hypothetical protein FQN54_000923 [Arachnomyces sp. PD_36]
MESAKPPQEKVIQAFKDRNLPFKREDIEAAFKDPSSGPNNVKWVEEHLGPETLLSKEETTLYAKLESSGSLPHYLQDPEISSTRPFLDDEIRASIDALNASTEAISKQNEVLTLQCKELKSQLRSDNEAETRRARALEQLHRRHGLEKQHTNVTVDDLTDEFETKLNAARELATAESKGIIPSVTSKLKEDDRILQRFEKLAAGLDSSEEDKEMSERAMGLTTKLAEYLAEGVHCRLDRVYLETVQSGSNTVNGGVEDEIDLIASLEDELDSLYPEIEVLAEMSTRQQFKVPILRELKNRHGQLQSTSEEKLDYILDSMMELTQSAEHATERLENHWSHRMALETIAQTYKTELEDKSTVQPNNKRKSMRRETMRNSGSFSGRHERRDSITVPEGFEALETLLRRLGISLPALLNGTDSAPAATLHEKKQRMQELVSGLHTGVDSPLAVHLGTVDHASQLLSSALHADSNFGVSLTDTLQEKKLADLEQQIGQVKRGIEGINLDILQRDKVQERFMERWL